MSQPRRDAPEDRKLAKQIDREEAEMAGVRAEVIRDNPQADEHEANVACFEQQLEPLSERAADFHATLTDIESKFLVP